MTWTCEHLIYQIIPRGVHRPKPTNSPFIRSWTWTETTMKVDTNRWLEVPPNLVFLLDFLTDLHRCNIKHYKITFLKRELWLVQSRVSITLFSIIFYNFIFITLSLSFYIFMLFYFSILWKKGGYFHVFVFYRLFYKRNRKHFFRVPIYYRNTSISPSLKLQIVFYRRFS